MSPNRASIVTDCSSNRPEGFESSVIRFSTSANDSFAPSTFDGFTDAVIVVGAIAVRPLADLTSSSIMTPLGQAVAAAAADSMNDEASKGDGNASALNRADSPAIAGFTAIEALPRADLDWAIQSKAGPAQMPFSSISPPMNSVEIALSETDHPVGTSVGFGISCETSATVRGAIVVVVVVVSSTAFCAREPQAEANSAIAATNTAQNIFKIPAP